MSKKKKIIISITGIAIVLLGLLGLTYGYYLTTIIGNTNPKSLSVDTKKLVIEYADGNGAIESSENLMPGRDIKFKKSGTTTSVDYKEFTVTNTGNDTAEYVVIIDSLSIKNSSTNVDTTFESDDFYYTLTCTATSGTCDSASDQIFPLNENGILIGNKIAKNVTQTYRFYLTYKDTGLDQSADMNKTMSARINLADIKTINPFESDKNSLAYNILNNSRLTKNGTRLVASSDTNVAQQIANHEFIKAKKPESFLTTSPTTSNYFTYASDYKIDKTTGKFTLRNPQVGTYSSSYSSLKGKYIVSSSGSTSSSLATYTDLDTIYYVGTSTSSSTLYYISMPKGGVGELSVAPDDLGMSYYYRGSVEDNYVNFLNKCWRIVRIEGDGAIKLVLEDKDYTCNSTSYTGNWRLNNTNYNYGYIRGYVNNTSGSQSSSYKYIGNFLNEDPPSYMTSTTKYAGGYSALTSWISTLDQTKLKTDTWCLGNTTDMYNSSGTKLTDLKQNLMYNGTSFYYETYKRLYGYGETRNAKYRCNKENDKTYTGIVGLISADEAVFAGGMVGSSNQYYYLINNYQKNNSFYFWTLSPAYFDSSSSKDYAFSVYGAGGVYDDYVSNSYGSFRPAVSLQSGITITSGDGTKATPYVIS